MAPLRLVVLLVAVVATTRAEMCSQGYNCKLPDCFCPTFEHPLGARIIPQIVYFGFDDALDLPVAQYYEKLFLKSRVNPNGCPITMSLYISDRYTDYGLVEKYYANNHEIADHSVNHTFTKNASYLRQQASDEKWNLVAFGGVPPSSIRGWRSPDLATAGDAQPRVLKELNFTYDISLPYIDNNNPGKTAFPFTLDFGYPYPCAVMPCPGKNTSHKGFWEVPVNAHYMGETPCSYIDACRPKTEEEAYNFLMRNFNSTYKNYKAPFGLNMHAAWFYSPDYLNAMERFIDTILGYHDVYIVNVQQMLEWMKTPKTIYESKTFEPWLCKQVKEPYRRHAQAEKEKKIRKSNTAGDIKNPRKSKANLNFLKNWFLKHKNKKTLSSIGRKIALGESKLFRAIMH